MSSVCGRVIFPPASGTICGVSRRQDGQEKDGCTAVLLPAADSPPICLCYDDDSDVTSRELYSSDRRHHLKTYFHLSCITTLVLLL